MGVDEHRERDEPADPGGGGGGGGAPLPPAPQLTAPERLRTGLRLTIRFPKNIFNVCYANASNCFMFFSALNNPGQNAKSILGYSIS